MKPTLFVAAAACVAMQFAAAAETPDGLIGHYRSTPRKVCVANGLGGRPTCSRIINTMSIQRSGLEGNREVKVRAEFTLPDAQICAFEGLGYWNADGRRLLVADAQTGCELVLEPHQRVLHAVEIRPEQCKSPCAGRTWLEGETFRKR
jgi:hypothetical protein